MNAHYQTVILGGGLSGLTVAHKIRRQEPEHNFLLIEKKERCGGAIKTSNDGGFITEIGPHGFLDNCEESQQILRETGLDRECVGAPLIDFVRYVFVNGKLNLIPQTPLKILKAPLIPWPAKIRVLGDLFKPALEGEPTVAKWTNYRFGPALLPYLDAVYTGTYAGDFDRLTIDSVMPGVRAIEKEHGSIIRGLLAKMRSKKKEGRSQKFQMPTMTSFPEGMERLVERLREPLEEGLNLELNCDVSGVTKTDKGWKIITSKGSCTARNMVMAMPVNSSLRLLNDTAPAAPMSAIPEAWIATVVFGFTDAVKIPPGFGFLTPEQEKRFVLGTLFSSNMFPGRAPEGHIVFETLVGGRRHPARVKLDDATLTQEALQDVKEILNIDKEPVYTTVLRSDGAIPQLERNYPALLQWRDEFTQQHPDVYICGFGWDGIGINDMIKHGSRIAEDLLANQRKQHASEVKGVYF